MDEAAKQREYREWLKGQTGCSCVFESSDEKRKKIADFLREYGDNIPEKDIKKSVKNLSKWKTSCHCKDRNKILSQVRWEQSDWYLCTIKNLATHKQFRGLGLASKVTKEVIADAIENRCLVLAADITTTNEPSMGVVRKMGFKPVNEFCWGSKEKPATILHFVRFSPQDGECK